MKTELHFISTLIATAEQRVARQAALVGSLTDDASATSQAARVTLRQMQTRLEKLNRGRAELEKLRHLASGISFEGSQEDDAR